VALALCPKPSVSKNNDRRNCAGPYRLKWPRYTYAVDEWREQTSPACSGYSCEEAQGGKEVLAITRFESPKVRPASSVLFKSPNTYIVEAIAELLSSKLASVGLMINA